MYLITAQNLLNEVKQMYLDRNFKMMRSLLKECEQGIFAPDISLDVVFKNTLEIGFELAVYQIVFENTDTLNLKTVGMLCSQFDKLFHYFESDAWNQVDMGASQLYGFDLQVLLRMTGDMDTLKQVFSFTAMTLSNYLKAHDSDGPVDNSDLGSINQLNDADMAIEGTKHVRRLLRKYGFDNNAPIVFSKQDYPKVDINHLVQWGLHNKVNVVTHYEGNVLVCYLEKRYFDLYQKLYNLN